MNEDGHDEDIHVNYELSVLEETDHMAVVSVNAFLQNLYFYTSGRNDEFRAHMLVETLLIPRYIFHARRVLVTIKLLHKCFVVHYLCLRCWVYVFHVGVYTSGRNDKFRSHMFIETLFIPRYIYIQIHLCIHIYIYICI
jgi:hypothetical protein